MKHPTLSYVFAALAISCGGDSGSPGPIGPPTTNNPTLQVTAPAIATRIGDTLRIAASLGTQTTSNASFSIVSEARWLDDLPVVNSSNVISGPGRADVRVSAFGRDTTITLRVEPVRTTLLSFRAAGDTAIIRGYRMSSLNAASVVGANAQVISVDSATLRVRIASATGAGCAGSSNVSFTIANADVVTAYVPAVLSVAVPRASEIDLSVGQELRVANNATCLRFRAFPGAVYHLAYFDARMVEGAKTSLVSQQQMTDFSFTIADVSGSSMVTSRASRFAGEVTRGFSDDVASANVNADEYLNRQAPWVPGDTFTSTTPWGAFPMTVVKVYGNHFVWSVRTSDLPRADAALRARVDSAFEYVHGAGSALWDAAYGNVRPVTNTYMSQYMVNTIITRIDSAGVSPAATGGPRVIHQNLQMGNNAGGYMFLLAHEYTHARDLAWQSANGFATGELWSIEGIAHFFAYETIRRAANIPFDANTALARNGAPVTPGHMFKLEPSFSSGEINRGYGDTAPLIRDFVQRVMRTGRTYDEAIREVAQFVARGWYGCNFAGNCSAVGIAERMAELLGSQWNPPDAVLRFLLSQSADDLTTNAQFQNVTFERVGARAIEFNQGVRPKTVLRGGSGTSPSVSGPAGSGGYLIIEDSNGGSYQITNASRVELMLLRVK